MERPVPAIVSACLILLVLGVSQGALAQSGVTAVKQQSFENDADSDSFGFEIAVDGDTLVIADHERETSEDYAGAVLVYRRDDGSWSRTDELTLDEPTDGAQFGSDIALQGDTLLVSAVGWRDYDENSAGEVHVFRRDGGQWSRSQRIRLADRREEDEFGDALALAGDTFVATAPGDRVDGEKVGAAHVYRRSGGEWSHRAKLPPHEGAPDGWFGSDVALAGDSIIVTDHGAIIDGAEQAGRAFVYRRTDDGWRGTDILTSANPVEKGWFGREIAAAGRTAFITAIGESGSGVEVAGAVYVYRLQEGSWQRTQRLEPDNPFEDDIFGSSVAIDGDRAVVGNDGSSTGDDKTIDIVGDVSVYQQTDATWTRTELFRLEECPGYNANFGAAIDLSGDTVAVSAGDGGLGGTADWTTHIFELLPDADGDGVPDSEDENPMSADGETSLPDCESDFGENGGGCGGCGAPVPYGPMMVILIVFGVRRASENNSR